MAGIRQSKGLKQPVLKTTVHRIRYVPDIGTWFNEQGRKHPSTEGLAYVIATVIGEAGSVPEEVVRDWKQELAAVFEKGQVKTVETRFESPSGIKYFTSQLIPEFSKQGPVESVLAICLDLTTIRRAENQIRLANERLQHLLSSTKAVIYTAKPRGDYGATFVSSNVVSLLGYQPQVVKQPKFWLEHVHPKDLSPFLAGLQDISDGLFHSLDYRFLRADGNYIWIRDELRLVFDGTGKPLEIIGYMTDITNLKKAEEALKRK